MLLNVHRLHVKSTLQLYYQVSNATYILGQSAVNMLGNFIYSVAFMYNVLSF